MKAHVSLFYSNSDDDPETDDEDNDDIKFEKECKTENGFKSAKYRDSFGSEGDLFISVFYFSITQCSEDDMQALVGTI